MPHIQPDTHLPKTPFIREYTVNLSAFGISDPTINATYQNTLGFIPTITRQDQGEYRIDGPDGPDFPKNKTMVTITNTIDPTIGIATYVDGHIIFETQDINTATNSDGFTYLTINIKIYDI